VTGDWCPGTKHFCVVATGTITRMEIAVALGLLALLLAVGLGFAWQERRRLPEVARIYGVEDAVVYVTERLTGAPRGELHRHDVRRILEWSVRYLQDPRVRSDPSAPVDFAGLDMGRYVQEQAIAQGHAYEGESIRAVLVLQAEYLAAIGAIGDPAG
jgi:hypothetical protein